MLLRNMLGSKVVYTCVVAHCQLNWKLNPGYGPAFAYLGEAVHTCSLQPYSAQSLKQRVHEASHDNNTARCAQLSSHRCPSACGTRHYFLQISARAGQQRTWHLQLSALSSSSTIIVGWAFSMRLLCAPGPSVARAEAALQRSWLFPTQNSLSRSSVHDRTTPDTQVLAEVLNHISLAV